ncbi:hypothetical protein EYF80_038197 [Liparis tanakae]|uniref:Uncharacterized protein n=1 Tax=Liparis tanakae TaxID=230148 RepID=A0A4Z2GEI8_9TELE|nr:hypothetical protein EYF80_038197 [Liparis tanakae]
MFSMGEEEEEEEEDAFHLRIQLFAFCRPPLLDGEKKNKTSREGGVTKQHNEMMRGGEEEEGHPAKGSASRLEGAARSPTTPPSTTPPSTLPPGHFAWRGCAPGIKPASSFRAHGEDGGGRTQSVSRHMVQSGQFDAARRLRNARSEGPGVPPHTAMQMKRNALIKGQILKMRGQKEDRGSEC